MTKQLAFSELVDEVAALRESGRTVVHCHGVFDLLHIGHIRYLQRAAELGDVVVVTVTPDKYVNKGPHRPVFPEELRLDAVAALGCVRLASINPSPTAVEAIEQIRPSFYAKGAEFRDEKTPELLREEAAIAKVGGEMVFIDEFTSSSSQLINNFLSPFPEATQRYLERFRANHGAEEVQAAIQGFRELHPVVIGEAIISEEVACEATGRSAKAPVVSAQYQAHARFVGGAVAVANHLAAFCPEVRLVTLVGDDGEEEFLRERLAKNVEMHVVIKTNAPTVRQLRYRESYFDTPLFELNHFDDRPLSDEERESLQQILAQLESELTFVADAGHTMLDEAVAREVCQRSGMLAVNATASSASYGRQSISRYSRADFICLARSELELECRRSRNVEAMLSEIAERLGASRALVTLGKEGCAGIDSVHPWLESAEGLALKVVDRTGGGDAFFAFAALATAAGSPLDMTMFLANVAGAEAVSLVGGSRFIQATPFERHALSLLK